MMPVYTPTTPLDERSNYLRLSRYAAAKAAEIPYTTYARIADGKSITLDVAQLARLSKVVGRTAVRRQIDLMLDNHQETTR